ncbi:TM0106 family RecB-like putative nuclease [Candidatus Parcubacteria bacterium]|nr:TM0106 family RecB-like putative nuclease [Candidatus Parcubacteria bacterium]
MNITASKLYNYLQCPHRVWRDVWGPKDEKIDEVNPFVQLLWDRGLQHEEKVISKLGKFLDLSKIGFDEAADKTIEAMKNGEELIYQGVLKGEGLMGIPDLIRRQDDGTYIPIDIKAGMGMEGASEEYGGKLKKHYAAQLCAYVELLKLNGFASENKGLIIDINEDEVEYKLDEKMGARTPRTWWEFYEEIKEEVGALIKNEKENLPANSGVCKLCPWCLSCKKWCVESDDLTNIFYLGRSKRDVINKELGVSTVKDISSLDIADIAAQKKANKKFLPGVGVKTIEKIVTRANIVANTKKPIIYEHLDLPEVSTELFFDIETDPTQNLVYLHGVYERKDGKERFVSFLSEDNSKEAEKKAWTDFWSYIRSLPKDDYAVYYYSPYEKTMYKKMHAAYSEVVSEDELEDFFAREKTIDLYSDIVYRHTDWPLGSYSIKEIAVYLGFKWRDESPSGALSIQWYNEYLENKDEKIMKRILEYNEDDCKAMMILKDYLVENNI